jgi:YVTN family beta-propeller protein
VLAPLLALAILAAGGASRARADGGAPNLAYVSGTKDGVAVIDIASQQVTSTIKLDGDPRGMVLSPDSRFLYVALAGKNGVAVIDALAKQVIHTYPTGPGPTSLTLDLVDPSHLWVANSGGNTVTVLNPDSGKQLAAIPVGLHPASINIAGPTSGITETDGSSEVLVANQDASSLTVIGSESFQVLATVPLLNGDKPVWVTVPAFGGTAYVATEQGHVYGFTLASHQFFGPVFTGQSLQGMDYDATTGEVYVPDSQTNLINVLRPVSTGLDVPSQWPGEPVRTLSLGGGPAYVAITSDGSLGLVAQRAAGDVTLMEVPPPHRVLGTVHVGGAPQFVLAGPFPPLVNRQSAQVILIVVYVLAGVLVVGGIVWLVWWMRKQERRIRQLRALEGAEDERELLAAQASDESKEKGAAEESSNGARPPEG